MTRGRRKVQPVKKTESSTIEKSKKDLDPQTALRRSLASSKPTWYSLNLSFCKIVDTLNGNQSIQPKSKEFNLLRDLRSESRGAFFLQWLQAFRQHHQLSGERNVRRNQVVCYLSLVDLIVALGFHDSMPFDFWWEMIEGGLYRGAFNDVIQWRQGKLDITALLKRFTSAYKHREHDDEDSFMQPEVPKIIQQQFKPFLDWYCIGAMIQWVDGTTPHLPTLKPSTVNLSSGQSWYQDDEHRLVLLKFIIQSSYYTIEGIQLTRRRQQLKDLSNWLELQISPEDIDRLCPFPAELSVAKIFLGGYSRSDKKDIEHLAELLVSPNVSDEDKQRLRLIVSPLITNGQWNDLYLFHRINPDMRFIYDFAIRWKLYNEIPRNEIEKSINIQCQTYEEEIISKYPTAQLYKWKLSRTPNVQFASESHPNKSSIDPLTPLIRETYLTPLHQSTPTTSVIPSIAMCLTSTPLLESATAVEIVSNNGIAVQSVDSAATITSPFTSNTEEIHLEMKTEIPISIKSELQLIKSDAELMSIDRKFSKTEEDIKQ